MFKMFYQFHIDQPANYKSSIEMKLHMMEHANFPVLKYYNPQEHLNTNHKKKKKIWIHCSPYQLDALENI